jgi:hypothetical protein
MKPFLTLFIPWIFLGFFPLVGQKTSTKLDQLFVRIQNAEAQLNNLRKPDLISPGNGTSEEKSSGDQVVPQKDRVDSPLKPKKQERPIPSVGLAISPQPIRQGESKFDQLLDRINTAQAKISTLQEPGIQAGVPSLPESNREDSVPASSPQNNKNPPPSPNPIPFVTLPVDQKEQELPVVTSVNNRVGGAQEFLSREPNEVRLRIAYIFPFESEYMQPITGTSLPLSYHSGRQLAFEYLFGSELLSLGTSILWSESKHYEIGPVFPLGTFPAHGRTRSFGGSLLARLSKDINKISFEALLSLGLARRLDEFRFDTGYFSEAGLSFLHSFDLGVHYEIVEDHKVGIYWRYQNLAGLNHNSENQNAQLGLSYAREF